MRSQPRLTVVAVTPRPSRAVCRWSLAGARARPTAGLAPRGAAIRARAARRGALRSGRGRDLGPPELGREPRRAPIGRPGQPSGSSKKAHSTPSSHPAGVTKARFGRSRVAAAEPPRARQMAQLSVRQRSCGISRRALPNPIGDSMTAQRRPSRPAPDRPRPPTVRPTIRTARSPNVGRRRPPR